MLIFSWVNKAVLGVTDFRQNRAVVQKFVINAKRLLHSLHNTLLVICVINGKVLCIAEPVAKATKHTTAHTVKCLCPNIVSLGANGVFKPFLKLACRLVGKGNGKHLPRTSIAVPDNMLYSFYNSCRFACAGACHNKHGTVNSINNLLLLCIWFYCVFVTHINLRIVNKRDECVVPLIFVILA